MAWKLVTDGQAACQLLGRYTQSTLAASCVCWIVGLLIVTLWLYQKNLWLFMFEMHLISGITDWWQGCESPPPVKLNIKNGPLPILYIGIYYSFGFSRYFFCVFGVFSGIFRFLYSRSIPDLLLFLNNFLSDSQWAPFS